MRLNSQIKGKDRPKQSASFNIPELLKKVEAKNRHRSRYNRFVNELNRYLKARFHCKADPIEPSVDYTTIDVSRASFKLYLRFRPQLSQYTKPSLVVANATFRQKNINGLNVISETTAFFDFLLQQSEILEYSEIYLERWCGVPDLIIEMHNFNRLDDDLGWEISCEALKLSMKRRGQACSN